MKEAPLFYLVDVVLPVIQSFQFLDAATKFQLKITKKLRDEPIYAEKDALR